MDPHETDPEDTRSLSHLPFDAAQLSTAERTLIGTLWARRAQSELTSGVVFANLSAALLTRGTIPSVRFLAARAVSDELRHAEVCRQVAARYLDAPVAFPKARRVRNPDPAQSDAALVATLHVVLNCCLNESVAMVFLRTCLEAAENDLVRAALRELMREEVDHARIGWAHLACSEVSDAERAGVGRALPRLIAETRRIWSSDNPSEVPSGHGCLSKGEIERVLDEALADLIVPGFTHLGVSVDPRGAYQR
jgi:hypothetical protein